MNEEEISEDFDDSYGKHMEKFFCETNSTAIFKVCAYYQGLVLLPSATKLRQGNVFTPVCDSVHRGGLCPGRSLSRGSLSMGDLCPGVLCQGDSRLRTVTYGRFASYWNAFLFLNLGTCNSVLQKRL